MAFFAGLSPEPEGLGYAADFVSPETEQELMAHHVDAEIVDYPTAQKVQADFDWAQTIVTTVTDPVYETGMARIRLDQTVLEFTAGSVLKAAAKRAPARAYTRVTRTAPPPPHVFPAPWRP